MKESLEFSNLFSPVGLELEERKNQIRAIRYKVCLRCKERKPLSNFPIDKRYTAGRSGVCKVCRSKKALAYYYENRERLLASIKEYQAGKDRSQYFVNYKRDHREHLQKIAHKWYRKNRKRIKKRR